MKNAVETALQSLTGLPFWGTGRAADLQWFQFGERHDVLIRDGGSKSVGTWALHIQCAWRIRDSAKVIVASSDCYLKADHVFDSTEEFDWDVNGANQRDQRMCSFMEGKENSMIVKHVVADDFGGFTLQLTPDFHIEVFPDVSTEDFECWRLFQPSTELAHFVVTSSGPEIH